MTTALERVTFTTSRLLDFFSEKELAAQTGHPRHQWPLVIVKELADNALDACEEAGVAPRITVTVDAAGITVADNGPGIPPQTVAGVLDYSVRISSRAAYCAPDRGAQGNALKTIAAMPFVLDGTAGHVEVDALGVVHDITVRVDPVRQEPVIACAQRTGSVRTGTRLTVHWPHSASSLLESCRGGFYRLAEEYAWLNPHLDISLTVGTEGYRWEPSPAAWSKWTPGDATSPHWYTPDRLAGLITAHLSHPGHEKLTVRDFLAEFRGLAGTSKRSAVLTRAGMARTALSDFVNGHVDQDAVTSLLDAMRAESRPVKPDQLGVIGRDHLGARLAGLGAAAESVAYRKIAGESGGLPWVIEAGFGYVPGADEGRVITGVNWSPGLGNPFRSLGSGSLDGLLREQRADQDYPVTVVVHLACPRVTYTDRGKSAVALDDQQSKAIVAAVTAVTAKWATQARAEERDIRARMRRMDAMARSRRVTVREAAWEVMEQAYMKASAGGTLPANARQVMYAARPLILEMTGRDTLDDAYFTQALLPDYVSEHGLAERWDVVYDARGHLGEPHTGAEVALGTLDVRKYRNRRPDPEGNIGRLALDYPTAGPEHRYSTVLFLEKEGFLPLLQHARIAERFDCAIMSTKGMSNVAARTLVDHLAARGVRLLIARDFDKAGFSIAATLTTDSRRYAFRSDVDAVDLGLRLADVRRYGLESEPVTYPGSLRRVRDNLVANGATAEEAEFLLSRRVELNALASDQFIAWLEAGLAAHGTGKVIPDAGTLAAAWRRARTRHIANHEIRSLEDRARAQADGEDPPGDLDEQVRQWLDGDPATSWDAAIAEIAASEPGAPRDIRQGDGR